MIIDDNIPLFQEYLQKIRNQCSSTSDILKCTKKIRSELFIMEEEKLQLCIDKKFKSSTDITNNNYSEYLDSLLSESTYYDFKDVPSVFINNELVRGKVEGDSIASAICDSTVNKPAECRDIHKVLLGRIQESLAFDAQASHKNAFLIYFGVTSGALFLLIVMYIIFKKLVLTNIEIDLESKVNSSIAQYRKVNEITGGFKDDRLEAEMV